MDPGVVWTRYTEEGGVDGRCLSFVIDDASCDIDPSGVKLLDGSPFAATSTAIISPGARCCGSRPIIAVSSFPKSIRDTMSSIIPVTDFDARTLSCRSLSKIQQGT